MFMCSNRVHAQRGQVIHCCAKTDSLRDCGSSGFELMREGIWTEGAQLDFFDHVTTAQEWRHLLEQLQFSIQRTNTCRSAHFVGGEGKEIRVECLHIYLQ